MYYYDTWYSESRLLIYFIHCRNGTSRTRGRFSTSVYNKQLSIRLCWIFFQCRHSYSANTLRNYATNSKFGCHSWCFHSHLKNIYTWSCIKSSVNSVSFSHVNDAQFWKQTAGYWKSEECSSWELNKLLKR